MLRVLNDDQSRVDELPASPVPSHDPVGARAEQVMCDSTAEPDAVDASVAPDAEGPDAPACGRHLDDHELDQGRPAEDEDERRPAMPARSAARDPVAGQSEAIDATRARHASPAATRPTGALTCAT